MGSLMSTNIPSDQHFYKVPLKGLELKSHPFSITEFAQNPRKINGIGGNVIVQNRLVCPQVWANGGHAQPRQIHKNMEIYFRIYMNSASMES